MRLWALLLAVAASAAVVDETKTVLVRSNGASEGGVEVKLVLDEVIAAIGTCPTTRAALVANTSDHLLPTDMANVSSTVTDWARELAVFVVKLAGAESEWSTPPRLFTSDGYQVLAWDLVRDGDALVLVPEDFHFIWPTLAIGHKREIDREMVDTPFEGLPIVMESLHNAPRVFHIKNFITEQEILDIIASAENITLHRSTTGAGDVDDKRTSDNAFDDHSPVARKLMHRIFQLLRMPFHDGPADGIQIVRYTKLQAYNSHHDYSVPVFDEDEQHEYDARKPNGSNRFATLFIYLTTIDEGGQTVFPDADVTAGKRPYMVDQQAEDGSLVPKEHPAKSVDWLNHLVDRCYNGFSVPSIRGDAVLFYSQKPDRSVDPLSLHGGCPPLNDQVKWGANLWVWNRNRPNYEIDSNPVNVTFINPLSETVEIFYAKTPWGTLDPESSTTVTTYPQHRWSFSAPGYEERKWVVRSDHGPQQTIVFDLDEAHPEPNEEGTDDDSLVVLVYNRLPVPVSVFWLPPDDPLGNYVTTIPPLVAGPVRSFEGHSFRLSAPGHQERVITASIGARDPGALDLAEEDSDDEHAHSERNALFIADTYLMPVSAPAMVDDSEQEEEGDHTAPAHADGEL